jgi:hypothetical protein
VGQSYATEWRKIYMERVRQIAGTGIDGIYVDIPYWMTHFDGWENTWASFDDYTVAAFKQKTGLDAKHDIKIGDFSDAGFRKWVDFRIQTFTDFMAEIDHTAKAVNPEIKTIPEIYPGIEAEAVRVEKMGLPRDFDRLPGGADYVLRSQALERETASFQRSRSDWACDDGICGSKRRLFVAATASRPERQKPTARPAR